MDHATGRTRFDWLATRRAQATICVLASVPILLAGRGLWFFSDTWAIIGRDLTTVNGWMAPHGGHWIAVPALLAKLVYRIAGMDFYPWYYLPRIILYALLAFGWARVLTRRKVDPRYTACSLLLILWLASSGYLVTVAYAGPIIVGILALTVARLVDRRHISPAGTATLGVALTVALASSAVGPGLWAGSAWVMAQRRRTIRYAAPIAVSGAIYLTWYLLVARRSPNPLTPRVPGIGHILASPIGAAELIGTGMAHFVGLSGGWAWPFFAVFVVVVGLLLRAGHLTVFDEVILWTGAAIAASAVVVRGSQGAEVAAPNRLYFVGAYLVIGLLPPLLSWATTRRVPTPVVMATILGLAGLQLVGINQEIDRRVRFTSADREMVETAAVLLAEGEPAHPFAQLSPQLTVRQLSRLHDDGWTGTIHDDRVAEARSALRSRLRPIDGADLTAAGIETDADPGCVAVAGGEVIWAETGGDVLAHLGPGPASSVHLGWSREPPVAGDVTELLAPGRARPGDMILEYEADPGQLVFFRGDWAEDEERMLCGDSTWRSWDDDGPRRR